MECWLGFDAAGLDHGRRKVRNRHIADDVLEALKVRYRSAPQWQPTSANVRILRILLVTARAGEGRLT
jgi:hypothetical protein